MVPSIMLLLLAAPRGLEPRNPESEAGVLPIRLRGNIYKAHFSGKSN